MRTLESKGIPICIIERKGYGLLSGYHLPPTLFTQNEAHAVLVVEKIIKNNSDLSLIQNFITAMAKIRAVMNGRSRADIEFLDQRTAILTGY